MRHLLYCLFLFYSCVLAFNANNYDNSTTLLTDAEGKSLYTLYWRLEEPNNKIYFAFEVKTLGWIGFGISEPTSGSMQGSDMMVASVDDDDDEVEISDRYAMEQAYPEEDECEDWFLISGTENSSTGTTTIEVWRYLTTHDTQDRNITSGLNKIVYAFGTNDRFGQHTSSNRGAKAITFFDTVITKPIEMENTTFIDYRTNFNITSRETNYICTPFALPFNGSDKHIIRIEPIINEATKDFVHHFLVLRCNWSAELESMIGSSQSCWSDSDGFMSSCSGQFWGWAPGMDPLVLPEEAGFRVNETALTYMAIQVHYDNPNGVTGLTDTSGVRMYFTEQLRPNDAGSIAIGDPVVDGEPIPPQQEAVHYEWNCPSECTETFAHDINVVYSFPHMHQIGTQIWTSHWRENQLLSEITRIDFWDFEFQQGIPVNFTIKPGDRLNVHCVYNSMSRQQPTRFSAGSRDEMCMVFLTYYPLLPNEMDYCGMATFRNTTGTICGYNFLSNVTNPTIRDPEESRKILFGEEPEHCLVAPSSTVTPQTTEDNTNGPKNNGSSGGKIAAAIIIIAAAVGALVGTFYLIQKKAKQTDQKHSLVQNEETQNDRQFVELE